MTGPLDPSEPTASGGTAPDESPGATPAGPAGPLGSGTFSLEGRAAPGLYFAGWLLSVLGGGVIIVALLAGGGIASAALGIVGLLLLALGLLAAAGSQALERQRRSGAYRGPSPFLLFAASVVLTVILGIGAGPLLAGVGAVDSPAGALVAVLITNGIYLFLVRTFVVGTGALSWSDLGLGRGRPIVRDLAAGALLALPVIVLTAILADLLVRLLGATPDATLPPSGSPLGLLANLVTAAVVAPLGEELFFRGFATTAWARTRGERAALVRGAIFFAIVHVLAVTAPTFGEGVARAAIAFLGRLPISIALGWIFLRRRSLYASIGLHAAFNGALVLIAEAASRVVAF